ncbi:hypothetical protein RUM44_003392 [Polyplax serrata]|uniref:Ig-like domain-containing protein n=1 Tax=Polyplax serrata TaxID=468196 RepID=A0ABR1AGA4_POLSC
MVLTGVEHHVVQGTKVLLQCIVYGARPAAKVTWYNGTEEMREDFVSTNSAVKENHDNRLAIINQLIFLLIKRSDINEKPDAKRRCSRVRIQPC